MRVILILLFCILFFSCKEEAIRLHTPYIKNPVTKFMKEKSSIEKPNRKPFIQPSSPKFSEFLQADEFHPAVLCFS